MTLALNPTSEDPYREAADVRDKTVHGEPVAMIPVASWEGSTILADDRDDLIGTTLNDTYTVERVLGEGGMGRVYLARHTRIAQKRVAVKLLHPEYERNREMLARFQREAEAAASIAHPNVVVVYDVDKSPRGLPYLVCEYLEGLDLGEYLKRCKTLPLPTVVHIVRQLCEGLGAAHRCGVIHRDLKPQNVFLVGDFSDGVPEFPFAKIFDFGLSKFLEVADGQLVTKTGVIMGTPAFMSPEQALGKRADARADIYGVGAIFYTCLTGQLPFEESTPQSTMLAVIRNEPRRPRLIDASIPEYAELVIHRAMAKQASDRYPDMATMLEALEPLVENRRKPEIGEAHDASYGLERSTAARPRLLFYLATSFAVLAGSLSVAVTGIEQVAAWSLNRLEFALLLISVAAVAITPTLLIIRRIRRVVWGNTNRVRGMLGGVRRSVLTAIGVYGLSWLGFRFFDGVVQRLMGEPMRANITWPGWDFLLPVTGVGAGFVALLRERAQTAISHAQRRAFVVALASVGTLTLTAIVLIFGLRWQARASGSAPTAPAQSVTLAPASKAESIPNAPAPTHAAVSTAAANATESASAPPPNTASSTPPRAANQASEQELADASARGADGWLSLANQYPTDPRVLRALVLDHASRAAELGKSMLVARRLFKVAPEEAKAADLQYLVQRAAETPGVPAEIAWKMLAEEMGSTGPDILYGFALTKPKLAERAQQLLNDTAVRARATPALAITCALRWAPTCAARVPLLDRAIQTGDERSLAVLGALGTGSAHGCGKNKQKPCLPACPEQVDAFRVAMTKLSQRLKGADRTPPPEPQQ